MEKKKHGRLFKFPAPTNRSTGPDPIDCLVNDQCSLTFLILCIFSSHDPPLPFSVEIPNFFMPNAKGILIFGQKLIIYLSICLYDAYDVKFMQLKGIFIKQSLDHKEITSSCLLISTNCSSLRGFVNI